MSRVEPSHEIRQAAMASFEIYQAFIDAGFTEVQSLTLVAQMFRPSGGGA